MNNRTKVILIICILNSICNIYAIYTGIEWLILIAYIICVSAMFIGMNLDLNNKKISKWFDEYKFFK